MGNGLGMRKRRLNLELAVIGVFLVACSQEEAPIPQEAPTADEQVIGLGAPQLAVPAPAELIPAQDIPRSTEVPIERVEGLMVSQPADQPEMVVIFASGIANSDGWTEPRLVPIDPNEMGETRSFNFVATSPAREMASNVPRPVEARLELDAFPPEVAMVRIVSVTNELTAFVGN